MHHKSQRPPPSPNKCSRLRFSPSRGHFNPKRALSLLNILEGVPKVDFPLQHTTGEATSSQPINKEGDKEEEEKEKEIVDVSDSEDLYKVFDHPWSTETTIGDLGHLFPETTSLPNEMGIQHRIRGSLLEMMESQVGNKALETTSQAKLPPLPTPLDS